MDGTKFILVGSNLSFPLDKNHTSLVLGRANVNPDEKRLSRRQASFELDNGLVTVTQLGVNSIAVDGNPLRRNIPVSLNLDSKVQLLRAGDEYLYTFTLKLDVGSDNGSTAESAPTAAAAVGQGVKRRKPSCKYGSKCDQVNPSHFEEFYHPEDASLSGKREKKQPTSDSSSVQPTKSKSTGTGKRPISPESLMSPLKRTQIANDALPSKTASPPNDENEGGDAHQAKGNEERDGKRDSKKAKIDHFEERHHRSRYDQVELVFPSFATAKQNGCPAPEAAECICATVQSVLQKTRDREGLLLTLVAPAGFPDVSKRVDDPRFRQVALDTRTDQLQFPAGVFRGPPPTPEDSDATDGTTTASAAKRGDALGNVLAFEINWRLEPTGAAVRWFKPAWDKVDHLDSLVASRVGRAEPPQICTIYDVKTPAVAEMARQPHHVKHMLFAQAPMFNPASPDFVSHEDARKKLRALYKNLFDKFFQLV